MSTTEQNSDVTSRKRKPSKSEATYNSLIDATQSLLVEVGSGGISSRRIADRAGVQSPLIHYYFDTMDDLYLAVFRRAAEQNLLHMQEAIESDQPLRAVWEINDSRNDRLGTELMGLASRSQAMRTEFIAFSDRILALQKLAVERHFESRGLRLPMKPEVAAIILTSIAHHLSLRAAHGILAGHEETIAYIESILGSDQC